MSNTKNTNTTTKTNSRKELFVYKECLKNHAATLGTTAIDGCGEFMPSTGNVGSTDTLRCSACGCHRNFHRKEVTEYCPSQDMHKIIMTLKSRGGSHSPTTVGLTPLMGSDNGREGKRKDDVDREGEERVEREVKKRQRTKFTKEQKMKLLDFANKAEWMIHRVDEGLVQQFCQEIGIKRKVVKVWMHNNKHHFVNKPSHFS